MTLLEGFEREREWAPANGISPRTSARYRDLGLPYVLWGGEIWIGPMEEARKWLLAKVRRQNPRRAA